MSDGAESGPWTWWDRHHAKIGWATVGALVGGVFAAWISSAATACGDGACRIYWPAVEAIGTWFGALGGLLAVGAAIATFRSSELERVEDRRRERLTAAERANEALAVARRVKSRAAIGSGTRTKVGTVIHDAVVTVDNDNTHATVHRVEVEIDGGIEGFETPRRLIPAIRPSSRESVDFVASWRSRPEKAEESPLILAQDQRQPWCDDIAARVVLTYVIDNVTWRRRGTDEPERIA